MFGFYSSGAVDLLCFHVSGEPGGRELQILCQSPVMRFTCVFNICLDSGFEGPIGYKAKHCTLHVFVKCSDIFPEYHPKAHALPGIQSSNRCLESMDEKQRIWTETFYKNKPPTLLFSSVRLPRIKCSSVKIYAVGLKIKNIVFHKCI